MKKKNLYWLVESAIMISVAVVLELVSKAIIPELPFGGQITIVSMLPVILVSWKYGVGRGIFTGLAYSAVEMLLGSRIIGGAFNPLNEDYYLGGLWQAILMLLFDYIIAFAVLGLAGMYKKAIKSKTVSLTLGATTVVTLRYISHIISGYILYGAWAEWFFTQDGFYSWGTDIVNKYSGNILSVIYSIIYNGIYMIPEIIFTTVAAVIISRIPALTKIKE